jgi:hypothetical protein
MCLDNVPELSQCHPAVDGELCILVAGELIGEVVDQRTVRLDQQRDQQFLRLEPKIFLGPAIKFVPRPEPVGRYSSNMRREALEIACEFGNAWRLHGVIDLPAGDERTRPRQQGQEFRPLIGGWQTAHASERGFARGDPAVDQCGMIDQERGHAEPGRVPDAEVAAQGGIERNRRR